MFNFLQEIPVNELVSGVHHAIRLINYRDTRHLDNENNNLQSLASRITAEIQYEENIPVKQMDEGKASKYIDKLTNIVLRRIKDELGLNKPSGKSLLEKLRMQKVEKVVRFDEMTDNEAILSQLAVPIWINQELIGMLNIEGPRKLLFENKNLTQQFVSQVAEIFRSAQEKDIFHRNLGMRVLTPLIFNIFIDAMQHLPRSNFFVLTRPILNGLEIRIYGVEYKKFDTEPFLLNLSHSSIDLDNIESRITSTNLFTKPTLHHFVGQWFEEVDKADMVEVEESRTDVVIRLEEFS